MSDPKSNTPNHPPKESNPKLTRAVMIQYEKIRTLGLVNMLDFNTVWEIAEALGFDEFIELRRKDYVELLRDYRLLMAHYDLKRN